MPEPEKEKETRPAAPADLRTPEYKAWAAQQQNRSPKFQKPSIPMAVIRELHPIGSTWLIEGVQSEPSLNGLTGRVVGYKKKNGRVKLEVPFFVNEYTVRTIALKPSNLASPDESASPDEPTPVD